MTRPAPPSRRFWTTDNGRDGVFPAFDPIEVGNLVARLAVNDAEIGAAQALRYRVFYEEMSAHPSAEVEAAKRDFDRFDAICDHLLVIDTKRTDLPGGVVGTYRLLRSSVANRTAGSIRRTSTKFRGSWAHRVRPELGRSCVEAEYRNRPTMQLLWQSIAQYIFRYDIVVMFGCASMPGTDPQALALPLSISITIIWRRRPRPRALDERYVDMRLCLKTDRSAPCACWNCRP